MKMLHLSSALKQKTERTGFLAKRIMQAAGKYLTEDNLNFVKFFKYSCETNFNINFFVIPSILIIRKKQ